MSDTPFSNTPPKLIERNEFGLIKDGVNYVFNSDGTIDWRKMIRPEFLVPNKQNFEKRKQDVPSSIENLDDKDLLILLGGTKHLATIRGYSTVTYKLYTARPDYVMVGCLITWTPNYETEGKPITFEALADASPSNTSGLGGNYLAAIAENRAFVRSVRNFLRINIISNEEIGTAAPAEEVSAPNETAANPKATLQAFLNKKNRSFEDMKSKLVKMKFEGAELWNSLEEIPNTKVFEILDVLQTKK